MRSQGLRSADLGHLCEWGGLPRWLSGKESACHSGDAASVSGSGRSPAGGNGNHSSVLVWTIPMDREAWRATVHGAAKNQTRLKRLHTHACGWGTKCPSSPSSTLPAPGFSTHLPKNSSLILTALGREGCCGITPRTRWVKKAVLQERRFAHGKGQAGRSDSWDSSS